MIYKGNHKLGDFFTSRRERGTPGLPMLSVTMNNGVVTRESLDRKMETNLSDEEHLLVREDDIVYNMMRMWQGASGLSDRDGLLSPAYVVLAPKKGIDPLYASYLFKSSRLIYLLWAYSYGLTSDRLRLYFNDFKRIPVNIPSLSEQRKIGKILLAWDRAISITEKLLTNSQQQKLALMRQLITGKVRLSGSNKKWLKVHLSDICEIGAGYSAPQEDKYFTQGKYSFFRVSDMGGSSARWLTQSRDKINKMAIQDCGMKLIPQGATLFTKSGASLLLNQRAQLKNPAYIVSHIGYAKAKNKCCDDFIYFLMSSIDFNSYSAGTSLPALQLSTLSKVYVLVPELEEQEKIAAVLNIADREIATLQQKLACLKQEKKALMQQLLTGKRRVKVDES
ncbi:MULTISPECIES: restriction endonuclease subunit S [Methylomonas]|uniref:Type I restriction modification DNA specificity domain-containing protein n=2 Tax=Methylomonas TaxID=416 RepID=A0A140E523_9GAMM|nr:MULTISPECIES: restriction endonuclease subunit S [Methylomonas]AMK75497.1 hypothetical protein JT25_003165 [Methylomonas denitrificans]OAI01874.1 hypothetical protein A1342_21485 [Methylomonas methanica]TCV80030.1 type I restriction enzyme S subunit [Methylomonas methanica]